MPHPLTPKPHTLLFCNKHPQYLLLTSMYKSIQICNVYVSFPAPGPSFEFTLEQTTLPWMDAEASCGSLVNLDTADKQAVIEQYITTFSGTLL